MRIISGSRRGKKLFSLEGMSVRPTADRVKEALFNILQFSLEGRRFLDLFAGSGQIGLEAVSRGAALAVLVDSSPASLKIIQKNVEATGFQANTRVVRSDALAYLKNVSDTFDVAFLDPPYYTGLLLQALPLLSRCMAPGGVILCEHPVDEQLPDRAGEFEKGREHRYGRIVLTAYHRQQALPDEKGD